MANLKTLKTRITSVKSTQKMTKAMKMVAASKLRRAKVAVETSRPYADKIEELMIDLASNISIQQSSDARFAMMNGFNSKNKTHLVIILSSDRGLCGGLNTSTVKYAKNYIDSLIKDQKIVKIFTIGKKAYDQLKSRYEDKIIKTNFGIFKNNIEYSSAVAIADEIIALFDKEGFDVCSVIYSKFKSAIAQDVIKKQLIPVDIKSKEGERSTEAPINYSESQEKILHDLLPKNLAMQIYNELLENSASEQGARMAAMESATNNAGKMIKNLTLIYNRTRQANITRELIDIVSGANAV